MTQQKTLYLLKSTLNKRYHIWTSTLVIYNHQTTHNKTSIKGYRPLIKKNYIYRKYNNRQKLKTYKGSSNHKCIYMIQDFINNHQQLTTVRIPENSKFSFVKKTGV